MKKKLLTLGMIGAMALSLVACGGTSDTKVIEGNTSSTATNSETGAAGFGFSYNGVEISVDADVAPVLEKLGEPKEEFTSPSCAGQGDGHLYTYDDIQIQTYPDGDKDLILYVALRTDNVATKEGIDLSSSKEDILAAYGDPTEETSSSLKFRHGDVILVFIFDGDSLISIEYDSLKN